MPDEPFLGTQAEENKYKEYCKTESDEAYLVIIKTQEEYDKQLLTLSTGVLAVLVAFLKDIVHLDSAVIMSTLYGSFACLGGTICLVLASFQVSNSALSAARVYWQKHFEGEYSYPFPDKKGKYVQAINIAAGLLFASGVMLAVIFIIGNLAHQSGTGRNK